MSRAVTEHDYIGLSEVSSFEQANTNNTTTTTTTTITDIGEKPSKGLNFKATELRLGLPGSEDDSRHKLTNNLVSGAKRGFSDAINGGSSKWVFSENAVNNSVLEDDNKLIMSNSGSRQTLAANASSKEQVVGWPPIRSSRKNSMAVTTQKANDDKDCNSESGCLYIKVSMDGAPFLRKVDLKTYGSYVELSSALEKMFSGFTTGQHAHQGVIGHNKSTKGRFTDNLHHSEYVLAYEDKDGDWMLVGDVPWNMFMDSCRRLRIMKSSEAVGLASRAASEE